MRFGFVGGSYTDHSVAADAQRSLNLYPAPQSNAAKARTVLHGTPGLSVFAEIDSPVRGLWGGENRLFAAGGSKLYEISSGGGPTELGDIGEGSSPVQMFPNGAQLFVVAGGAGYLHTGTELEPVVASALQGGFMDGYFLAVSPEEGNPRRFVHSELQNGLTWDALDFASKEGYPDALLAMLCDHNDLWLFGSESAEIWRNNQDPSPIAFPWERDPGAFIHYGVAAPWSVVRLGSGVAWLAGDRVRGHVTAVRAQGYQPIRVSTHAIEAEWATYSTAADAEAYSYMDGGHDFWVITFPTANKTWVYDAATNFWHERGGWSGTATTKHRSRGHAFVFGKHLVGDFGSGNIYQMSRSLLSDAGDTITRLRRAPHIAEEEHNLFHHRLQLDLDMSGTPALALRWSDDGGFNWSTAVNKSPSAAARKKRVLWNRLGHSRDRVYEVVSTTSAKHVWIDAYLNATGGQA